MTQPPRLGKRRRGESLIFRFYFLFQTSVERFLHLSRGSTALAGRGFKLNLMNIETTPASLINIFISIQILNDSATPPWKKKAGKFMKFSFYFLFQTSVERFLHLSRGSTALAGRGLSLFDDLEINHPVPRYAGHLPK